MAALKVEAGQQGILSTSSGPGLRSPSATLSASPGQVRESRRAETPPTKLSVPEDVAPVVVFLGAPANGNITGAYLPVAGGIDSMDPQRGRGYPTVAPGAAQSMGSGGWIQRWRCTPACGPWS